MAKNTPLTCSYLRHVMFYLICEAKCLIKTSEWTHICLPERHGYRKDYWVWTGSAHFELLDPVKTFPSILVSLPLRLCLRTLMYTLLKKSEKLPFAHLVIEACTSPNGAFHTRNHPAKVNSDFNQFTRNDYCRQTFFIRTELLLHIGKQYVT